MINIMFFPPGLLLSLLYRPGDILLWWRPTGNFQAVQGDVPGTAGLVVCRLPSFS